MIVKMILSVNSVSTICDRFGTKAGTKDTSWYPCHILQAYTFHQKSMFFQLLSFDELFLESKRKIRGLMTEFIGITTMVVQISKFTEYLV